MSDGGITFTCSTAALDQLADRIAQRLAARLTPQATPDRWLTTAEAAEHLRVSVDAVHRLTAARQIPFHQDSPGSRYYFRLSELDEWRCGASKPLPAVGNGR